MACSPQYLDSNGKPSQLWSKLKYIFGEQLGERYYLSTLTGDYISWYGNKEPDLVVDNNGQYLLMNSEGDVVPVGEVPTQQKVRDPLSTLEEVKFEGNPTEENPNKSRYSYKGRPLLSVSEILNEYEPYDGNKAGKEAAEYGTRIHDILEQHGKYLTGQGGINMLGESLPEHEANLVRSFSEWLNMKLDEGGELRFETIAANPELGIAGRVDLMHIKPNGRADIYDFKTAHDTFSKQENRKKGYETGKIWDVDVSSYGNYKNSRYSAQVYMYKKLLESPSKELGYPGMNVDNAYVIPIEVGIDENNNPNKLTLLGEEDVTGYKHFNSSKQFVDSRLGEDSFHKYSKSGESSTDFIHALVGTEERREISASFIDSKASEVKVVNGEKYFFDAGKRIKFDNQGDSPESNAARREEVKKYYLRKNLDDQKKVTLFLEYLEGKKGTILSSPELKRKFDTFTAPYRINGKLNKKIKFSRLSDIKGFEDQEDVVKVDHPDGSFDLISIQEFYGGNYNNTDGKNIASKYLEDSTNSRSGKKKLHLTKSKVDVAGLRLAMNAAKLLEGTTNPPNPKIRVIDLTPKGVSSTNFKGWNLSQFQDVFSRLLDFSPFVDSISKNHVKLLNSLPQMKLEDNYLERYVSYVDALQEAHPKSTPEGAKDLSEYMASYQDSQESKNDLYDKIVERMTAIKDRYFSIYQNEEALNKILKNDLEYLHLAQFAAHIQGINLDPQKDINNFLSYLTTNSRTNSKVAQGLDQLYYRATNKIQQEFTDFIRPAQEKFYNYFKSMGMGSNALKERLYYNTDNYFKPLYYYIEQPDGSRRFGGRLLTKEDPEWGNLTDAQKEIIHFTNKSIRESLETIFGKEYIDSKVKDGSYPDGFLPIIKRGVTKEMRLAAQSGNVKEMRKSAGRLFKSFFKNYEVPEYQEDNLRELDATLFSQAKEEIHGSTRLGQTKQRLLGLDENGVSVDDSITDNQIETNLEILLQIMKLKSIKKKEYDKFIPMMYGLRTILNWNPVFYNQNNKNLDKMVYNFGERAVFGRNLDKGEMADYATYVDAASRLATLSALGLNLGSVTVESVAGAAAFTSDMFADFVTGDVKASSVAKAWKEVVESVPDQVLDRPDKISKVDSIMSSLGITEDFQSLKDENITNKNIFQVSKIMALNSAPEYMFRSATMATWMIDDGVYEAYEFYREEGKPHIKYNEDKDRRFKHIPGDTEGNKKRDSLKLAIKQQLLEEGGDYLSGDNSTPLEERRILRPYTTQQLIAMKNRMDVNYQSKDAASKAAATGHFLYRFFSRLKSYMRDKIIKYFQNTQYDSPIIVEHYVVPDGKGGYITHFKNGFTEGVAVTLWKFLNGGQPYIEWLEGPGQMYKDRNFIQNFPVFFKQLDKERKKNLVRAAMDMSIAATAIALSQAELFGGEDDDEEYGYIKSRIERGLLEPSNYYDPRTYLELVSNPFIVLDIYLNTANSLYRTVVGDEGVDTQEVLTRAPIFGNLVKTFN